MDSEGIEEEKNLKDRRRFIYAPLKIKILMVSEGFKDIDCAQEDGDKRTSLHIAARHRDIDTIKWLTKNGANLDILDKYGYTALHLCVFEPSGYPYPTTNPEIFFFLIANGANPFIENYSEQIPSEWAERYNKQGNLDDVIQFYEDCKSKDCIFTYAVAALKERIEYHYLDASTFIELYQMIGQ